MGPGLRALAPRGGRYSNRRVNGRPVVLSGHRPDRGQARTTDFLEETGGKGHPILLSTPPPGV
jgi:hypothetical protein